MLPLNSGKKRKRRKKRKKGELVFRDLSSTGRLLSIWECSSTSGSEYQLDLLQSADMRRQKKSLQR